MELTVSLSESLRELRFHTTSVGGANVTIIAFVFNHVNFEPLKIRHFSGFRTAVSWISLPALACGV